MRKVRQSTPHLFICQHHREGKGCCFEKGGAELATDLKSWVKSQGGKDKLKVRKSSCLGHCENGVAALFVGPEGTEVWLNLNGKKSQDAIKKELATLLA